jgi:hypothetical protein
VLADPDAKVLVEGPKNRRGGLALRRAGLGVGVITGQPRHEMHPPKEPEHLHQASKDPDGRSYGQDAPEAKGLRKQHRGTDHQEPGEHERPPQQDQRRPSRPEPLQDLLGRAPEDVR